MFLELRVYGVVSHTSPHVILTTLKEESTYMFYSRRLRPKEVKELVQVSDCQSWDLDLGL